MGKRKWINYDTWGCRIPDKQILIDSDNLTKIDNLLLEAVERLSGIAEFTRLSYDSQFDRMDEAVRIYDALIHLQEGVQNELYEKDYDFFTRLANGTDRDYQGPLETLSSIHMEDFSIPNEAGLTKQAVYYNTNNERCLGDVVEKETLTFEDFLCYSDNTDYEVAYNPVFEEIFREQYELAGLDEEYAYSVYMKELLESGEFDHEMQQPVLEFLSAGLDIVSFGLKPLIEAFLGEDLVTGDNLTDTDRFLSAVEGIIGLITFGNILSKVGVMGIEGVTAELAKEVLTDSVSNMTSEGLNELGVNGTVSTLAGVAVGGLTEQSLDDMLNVRLWGSRMEVAETPEEAFQFRFDDESRKIIEEVHEFDELDEWEEFYESMYDSQRDICVEYDDCLEDMRQVEYDDVLEIRSREAVQSVGEECGKTIESGLNSVDDIIKGVENGDVPLSNNIQKGNYGEMKMDAYFESQGYERISLDRVTDLNTPTHQGIDGVYYNPDGHPPYIIGEAKYGSSKLGNTLDGKQMSDNWVDKRLVDAVGEEMADDIALEMMINPDNVQKQLVNISTDGNVMTNILDEYANVVK